MERIKRRPVFSGAYKRDYKRLKHDSAGLEALREILDTLVKGGALPKKANDHALSGDWRGYRECHVKPDLLLVYKIQDNGELLLARLRKHGSLFG